MTALWGRRARLGRQSDPELHSQSCASVSFINALIEGRIGTLRITGPQITSLHERPRPGDRIVDLQGDRLLPGLINAHDHLQLNSLPPLELAKQYRHVKEWIADINARRHSDPSFESYVAVSRDARLLIGGIKNLLSGVTCHRVAAVATDTKF